MGKEDYTNFLRDYSKFDVFEPLIEPEEDAELRDKNMYRKFNLTRCILKSIVGCMFRKNGHEKETFLEFVERVKKGENESLLYQYDVLCRFSLLSRSVISIKYRITVVVLKQQ